MTSSRPSEGFWKFSISSICLVLSGLIDLQKSGNVMTPTAPLRTIGLTSDYYFSTFRNWAWLNWSKSSACFVVLWIVSGTFLSLPLTETWGKLGHEEETFSCTITSSDGKQRSTKNPLFFLMILGKYYSFTSNILQFHHILFLTTT